MMLDTMLYAGGCLCIAASWRIMFRAGQERGQADAMHAMAQALGEAAEAREAFELAAERYREATWRACAPPMLFGQKGTP